MTAYLLDTNIILRLVNPADTQHNLVVDAVDKLVSTGEDVYLAPQVLIEMWVVATRPTDVNGLGWSPAFTRKMIESLLARFPMLAETDQVFPTWLNIVSTQTVSGKRAHDARIAAAMQCANLENILTLNPRDFATIDDISPIHPQQFTHG